MTQPFIFRQLFDEPTSTYTYLLADANTKEAILIDPVYRQLERDMAVLNGLGLKLKVALETHIHADHVTAGWALKKALGCQIVLPANCGGLYADHFIEDNELLEVGQIKLKALHTPGHTDHHMSYHWEDKVFTGDALLINACGRTDFQSGDAGTLFESIHQKLFSLPDETFVYPGHDYKGLTVTTIGEQKELNPRLAKTDKNQFIEIMENLNLDYPYRIITSVPKNLISFNQDKLIESVSKAFTKDKKVLNLGKDMVFDTLAMADKLNYQSWQIATPANYQDKMLKTLQKSKLNLEPLLTVHSTKDWGFTQSYDIIYAESLFDEMSQADISPMIGEVVSHLNPKGAFCLYSQFEDDPFATHQEINKIWRAKDASYGLKSYQEIAKTFESHGFKANKQPLDVGFSLCIWEKSA